MSVSTASREIEHLWTYALSFVLCLFAVKLHGLEVFDRKYSMYVHSMCAYVERYQAAHTPKRP